MVTCETRTDALAELYMQYYNPMVRLAALLLRDQHAAEDVVQDAFAAMATATLRNQDSAPAFLRRAVINGCRSVQRRYAVADRHPPEPLRDVPSAEYEAMLQMELSAVVAALHTLPRRQREAVVLRYYADLSEADTAAAMGVRQGTVKAHAHRGVAALRAKLERQGYALPPAGAVRLLSSG